MTLYHSLILFLHPISSLDIAHLLSSHLIFTHTDTLLFTMGEATPLSLRPDLPYPITLTRLVAAPGTRLRRGDRLLEYSFTSATRRRENAAAERDGKPVPPERRKDDMVGSWESPIDGEVVSWSPGVHAGMVIEQRHAR